jgi:hypothetical protein
MTTEAIIMMLSSWGLITYFAMRFFIKVLRSSKNND